MKQFVKKHKHHFGLWVISGLVLILSTFWLNNADRDAVEQAQNSSAPNQEQSNLAIENASGTLELSKSSLTKKESAVQERAVVNKIVDGMQESIILKLPSEPTTSTATVEEKKNIVTFQIEFPQEKREFKSVFKEGDTVYDAMVALNKEQNLKIKFKEFAGLGAMVDSINDLANDAHIQKFWIYYYNGQLAKIGVSSLKLINNDIITWRYEAGKD